MQVEPDWTLSSLMGTQAYFQLLLVSSEPITPDALADYPNAGHPVKLTAIVFFFNFWP